MSGPERHSEKRQVVAENPKTDIPNVNVSINVERPIVPGGQILESGQTFQPTQTSQPQRLDENTLQEFNRQNKDTQMGNVSSDTTRTNFSNEESLKDKAKDTKENLKEKAKDKKEDVKEKAKDTKEDVKEKAKDTKEDVKEKAKDTKEDIKEKAKDKKEDVKEKAKDVKENVKEKTNETYEKGKEKVEEKTNMVKMMKTARNCLQDFINPSLPMEKQIPIRILSNAFGLLFLTEYKGSFGIGSSMGTGLIIARKPDRQGWTGPCAIGMGGLSIGFQAGIQKINHIVVLRDEEVLKTFVSKGQLKLGGDISFAVGPLGRDAQISLNVNDKDYAPVYSYSMSKGLHLGASLEGQIIIIRDDCNEDYYGKKVSAKDILFGKVDSLPNDNEYSSLIRLVDEYTQKQGQLSQDWFTNENRQNKEEEHHEKLQKNEDTFKSTTKDWERSQKPQSGFNEKSDINFNEKPSGTSSQEKPSNAGFSAMPQSTGFNQNEYGLKQENIEKNKDWNKQTQKKEDFSDKGQMWGSDKREQSINMDRLLKHARFTLENFMNPKLDAKKQIPVSLLNNACGILFLTEIKGGFGVGGSTGAGFIIGCKPNENNFSEPCAVGMGGISFGFQMGGQKTEHILIFRDEQVLRSFIRKGELNFGGDVSFSVGPLGRDVDTPLNANDKGYSAIYSYSMANGAYLGVTMERQMLKVVDDWNENYFGKRVGAEEILFGNAKPLSMAQHQSYESLINLIKEYRENKGSLNDSYWNEQDRKEEEYWKSDNTSFGQQQQQQSVDTSNMETDISEKESNDMHRLLSHAYRSFQHFVSPNLAIEKRIPIAILRGAHAIIFLTEIKAGLVVGASMGRGFILARRQGTDAWTGPCAISLGGMSVGWLAGAEKTNHILVLRESKVLQEFLSKGQLKFGGDLSFAIGPLGRDASISVNVNDKGYAPIYSYSFSKGAYMGASLDGHVISIRDDINEAYYGTKVKAEDILHGVVESPKDEEYKSLCNLLDQYVSQNLNYSADTKDTKDFNVKEFKDVKDIKDKDIQNIIGKDNKDVKITKITHEKTDVTRVVNDKDDKNKIL